MAQGKLLDISAGALILDYGESPHENVVIRPTLGTINVNSTEEVADVFEEEFGDAPVDSVSKGMPVTIECPFTRLTGYYLKQIFPNKIDIQSGDELIIKNCAGYSFFDNSVPAVIRPIVCNELSVDRSTWIYFYHVHPVMTWTLGYDRENQRVFMVNFKVYPTQSGPRIGDLYKIGV